MHARHIPKRCKRGMLLIVAQLLTFLLCVTLMNYHSHKKYPGFSLLEILIAAALGLLLIAGMVQIYSSAQRIFNKQDAMARLQENIHFASFVLQQNIMQAGYSGCRKLGELNLANHSTVDFLAATAIRGYDSDHLPDYLFGSVIPNTDVLEVSQASADSSRLIGNVNAGAVSLRVRQNPATATNQLLLLADCINGELFVAKNWVGNTITAKTKFKNSYQAGVSTVSRFESIAYFVSDTKRVTAKNEPIYSLYFMTNGGNKQELIPEVASMKILYGVDSKNKCVASSYLSASAISSTQWAKVISVDIILEPQRSVAALKAFHIYTKLRERC